MGFKTRVQAIELTSIDSATLTGNFQPINPDGLDEACFLLRLMNDSNQPVTISYDGVTAHDILLDNESFEIPVQTNARKNADAQFAKGMIIYASGTAGTGDIYVAGYYQKPQQ